MRARLAIAVASVVFLVLAGTGVSFAWWSTSASTSGSVAVASPSTTNCVSPTKLVNGSFESPNISPNPYSQLTPALVNGWAVLNDNVIEIWRGQGAVVPPTGAQLAELNGNAFGTLYQDVVTVPGQTLRWSVQHRGREGVDGMRVSVNASGGALVQQDQFTDPVGPWVLHTGAYVVPPGQTSTRISLVPVSTHNNNLSIGNLIDDVTFGSGPCLQVASAVTNVTTGLSTYKVGDVVQYTTTVTNAGGAPATPSSISAAIPTNLTYLAGSLVVDGVARTDAAGDDVAGYSAGTVSARIGYGATATVGGIVSPEQSVTFTFRATIGAAAAGTNLSYSPTAAYADLNAPLWPLSTTPTALSTAVGPAADIGVAVLASPTITASGAVNWTFRVTNNGPAAATGVSVGLTLTSGPTYGTVTYTTSNAGPGTANCTVVTATTRTCAIGAIPAGEGRTITIPATLPASPTSLYPVVATVTSTSSDLVSGNNTATNTGLDGIAPSVPTGFTATRNTATPTTIDLAWTGSTDPVGGVTGYRIYRNGALLTTVTGTTHSDSGLTAGTPYWYWVQAIDAAGNASAASTGEGAVTFLTTTTYRIYYPNSTPDRCLGANNDNDNAALEIQTCATNGNQRWTFIVVAGDVVRLQPTTTNNRRWSMAADSTTDGTPIILDDDNIGTTRASWDVGVVWDTATSTAHVRFANGQSGKCLYSPSLTGANGTDLQHFACSTTSAAQRFYLVVYS